MCLSRAAGTWSCCRAEGLRLKHPNPDTTETLPIPAVAHPSEITFREDDVVLLTMKSQDTSAALEDLRIAAGDEIPVICLQNGVENERIALRRFRNVYGVLVIMPANYVEPGIVDTTSWPTDWCSRYRAVSGGRR